jgi:acyl-CoA dehydrogenase
MTEALLTEATERLFGDRCTFGAVQAAERTGWAADLWQSVAEMGLPWISLPEEQGGSGGSLGDALEMLRIAGRHAAPLPLAETGVLAGWLCCGAGFAIEDGPTTLVPGRPEDTLMMADGMMQGVAHCVPWARATTRIVVLVVHDGHWFVACARSDEAMVDRQVNLAGEPRDTITFDRCAVDLRPAAEGVDPFAVKARGALARSMMIAGALERMTELTIEYAGERRQFGKSIGEFQAVQEHLVHCAQNAAIVGLAARTAARKAERGNALFEVGAAKLLANQAASTATRAAHQVHGALGMTQEYALHHLSRRLWAWSQEYGNERFWSRFLGGVVQEVGADNLYPLLAHPTIPVWEDKWPYASSASTHVRESASLAKGA